MKKPARRPAPRDLFRVEPLEARLLLSADPVLGAAQVVLQPPEDSSDIVAQAYAAPADVSVATTPGSTVWVASGATAQAAPAEWLTVDTAQFQDGSGRVVVGGSDSNAVIRVGEAGGDAVRLADLVLVNPQAGGEIFLQGDLQLAGSLVIQGSGHTTTITADVTTADSILDLDSVVVSGSHVLTAGTDGSGDLQLGLDISTFIDGNGDASPDALVLRAPGNVLIAGNLGSTDPLEGLTIDGVTVGGSLDLPDNVEFDGSVTVNGDLVINATGTVVFQRQVVIGSGGDLRITGADHVVFAGGLRMQGVDALGQAGDILIEANEIDFQGNSESVSGSGTLTLRTANVGDGVEIGSPGGSVTANTLNLDNGDLRALADGFQSIVIGHEDGGHALAGSGSVRIGAIDALDQPTLRDPLQVYGGSIVVEDLSSADYRLQVQGSIKLDAVGDITISNRIEASTGTALADIELWSATGRVAQVDAVDDGALSEPLRAANLSVHAANGISLPFTEVATVSASNTASGDLRITETASGGDVTITLLSQAAANAAISLHTTAGNISVAGSGIDNAGSGLTELQAGGSGRQITVDQAIHSAAGAISLTAAGAITTSGSGQVVIDGAADLSLLAQGGAIQQGGLLQSAGGRVSLDAFTTLAMADGARTQSLDAIADSGAVSLRARGGNVTLSQVAADGSIAVTAAGAILDGLTGNNPNLDGETAAVLLAAIAGIGSSGNALQTRVQSLAASNTASGGIFVREATGLRIAGGSGAYGLDAGGSEGSIVVTTAEGAITVAQAVRSTGGVGQVLLSAGETTEATAAGLALQADVSTVQGSVSLLAADGITMDDLSAGSAPTVSVAAPGASVEMVAADGITMEGEARIASAGGDLSLWAQVGSAMLGRLEAGSGRVAVRAGIDIRDAQDDDAAPTVNITASAALLAAGGAIGAPGALLETQLDTLSVQAGGALLLAEQDELTIGAVDLSVRHVADDASTAAVSLAGVAQAQSGATLVLQSGGTLTVQGAVTAAGPLRLAAAGALVLQNDVHASAGDLSLLAGSDLQLAAGRSVIADAGTLDLASTGGAVTLAVDSALRTSGAALRVAAAGSLSLGLLDTRSAVDRAAGSIGEQANWGDASVLAGGDITGAGLYARNLRLQAGGAIGSAAQALDTEAARLGALAGAAGLFVREASALALGAVGPVAVRRVGSDGVGADGPSDDALSGLSSAGALVLRTEAGALSLDAGSAVSAAGNLLLQAQGTDADLVLDGAVGSSGGSLSLAAGRELQLAADVTTSASGQTIDLLAQGRVTQSAGRVETQDGNLSLQSIAGDVVFGDLSAGTGGVWVSGVNLLDADGAVDDVDLVAGAAQLRATGGDLGRAGAALETRVGTLSALAAGQLVLAEADGVVVDRLQIDVQRVGADGATTATVHEAQEDLAAGGLLVLATASGDLAVHAGTADAAGVHSAGGGLRLEATTGQLQIDAGVDAGSGNLSLLGATGLGLAATGSLASAGGSIELESSGGGIAMADGSAASTDAGAIRLAAAGDVTVGRLDARTDSDRTAATRADAARWGAISVVAGGAILDKAGDTTTDLQGGALRLQAAGAIGSGGEHLEADASQALSAVAGAGVFLSAPGALTLGDVAAVTAQRVGADGSLSDLVDAAQSGLAAGGAAVVQAAGTLRVRDAGLSAAGPVLLQAQGAGANLALDAAVASSAGSLQLEAGQDVLLSADVTATEAGRSVWARAGRHVMQAQGTRIATQDGGIALEAGSGGTVTVETLAAGGGGVYLAGDAIVDGDAAGDGELDISAARVSLASRGDIGAAGAALEIATDALSAQAAGDVFLAESDGLALASVSVALQQVDATGAAQDQRMLPAQGLSGRNVVLQTLAGSLSSAAGADIAASGNLLLQALGANSDIDLAGAASAGGAVTLQADRDIVLTSSLAATSVGRSVDLLAQRRIDAQQGSAISAQDGNVFLQALAGTVTLESVNAGTGTVRLAGTSIIDGDAGAGETEVDVVAGQLQIAASTAIGSGANPLETRVGTLAASTPGTLAVAEADALVLGTVSAAIERVGLDGAASPLAPVSLSGLAGGTVLVRAAGSLSSDASATVTASGNLLLQASGAGADLQLGARVSSSGGSLSLSAGRDLLQGADITASNAGSTLDLVAGRDLTQVQGVAVATIDGHASLQAGGTLTLETIRAGIGRVSLMGARIVDGDAAGDSEIDVQANGLRVIATAGGIGASGNALETQVSTLSARATGDLFVTEADALELGPVAVTIQRVGANGSLSPVLLAAQDGLAGAKVVIRTLAGSLASQSAGAVDASGELLLQAGGSGADLTLAGAVSGQGAISLAAAQDLLLNATVTAEAASGSIDMVAGRNFTQSQGTQVRSAGGNIALQAGGVATLESLDAGAGGVRLAAGSVVDGDSGAGEGEVDILAARLQLVTTGAVGSAGNALETRVQSLAASVGGDLFLMESDGLATGSFAVDVQRVDAAGAAALAGNTASTGLRAQTLVLQSLAGSLQVQAGAELAAGGNLLLATLAADGDLVLDGATTAQGDASLRAGRDLLMNADAAATGAGKGLQLQAGRDLTQAVAARASTLDGPLSAVAGGVATLARLDAGAGVLRLQAASAVDADPAGDGDADLVAAGVQLLATGAFGSLANPIEVNAGTLAAQVGGALMLADPDGLVVGSVTAATRRVGADGASVAEPATTLNGVSAGGALTLWTGASLQLQADVSATGAGQPLALHVGTDYLQAAGTTVSASGAGTIDVVAGGTATMDTDTAALRTGTGNIHLSAQGDVRPGALVTQGHAYVTSLAGQVLLQGNLQRDGQDIDLTGDDLNIQAPVASPGGTLRITPTTAVPIVLGAPAPTGSALYLDPTELALLQDGFAQIVIGSSLDGQRIELLGGTTPLVFRDPLLLNANAAGGTIAITGALQGDSLQITDSGDRTTLTDSTLGLQGQLLVQDQLTVSGANSLAAGLGGSGTLHLTQAVTGAGGAADTLALSAQGGDVLLDQDVSGLDGLSVSDAVNVRFGAGLSLDGDLVIQATGTVTFHGPLTLAHGGRLIVRGGASVVFESGADLGSGDALLQVSAIQAGGGAASLRGTGVLQLEGVTEGTAIHVGGGASAGALQIGDEVLRAVGAGFQALRIGAAATAGAGAVMLGESDFSGTASPVEILGSAITVAATGSGLRLGTGLSLHAAGAIEASGQLVATRAADVSLTSDAGAIAMAAGSAIRSLGGQVAFQAATGLAVAGVDARDGAGGGGIVTLRSTAGAISDANADDRVDIYAQAVDWAGTPVPAGGVDLLEVSAPAVRVDAGRGIVTRQSGVDGRVYFDVLDGAALAHTLVAVGATSRITSDPASFIADGGLDQLLTYAPSSAPVAPLSLLASKRAPLLPGTDTQVQAYLASLPTAADESGLALSQGLLQSGDAGVDYWSESLTL